MTEATSERGINMPDGLDENQLLELIEDQLDEAQTAPVRQHLTHDPDLVRLIARMREDRAILKSDPEPALDFDIVTELGSVLAKPMLLDDGPAGAMPVGAARRARQRSQVRRQARRVALAAVLGLAATAAMFALYTTVFNRGAPDPSGDRLADRPANPDAAADAPVRSSNEARAVDDARLAHRRDGADDLSLRAADPNGRAGALKPSVERFALAGGAMAVESMFAIELSTPELDVMLARMAEMVGEMETAALVRNFTYAEVQEAWNRAVAANRPGTGREEYIASLGERDLALRFTPREQRELRHTVESLEVGAHLAGQRKLAALPEEQFRFGEGGASYAITLPVAYLPAFLTTLDAQFAHAITLRPIEARDQSEGLPAEWLRWQQWREAIETIDTLASDDPDLMVVIPIVVGESE